MSLNKKPAPRIQKKIGVLLYKQENKGNKKEIKNKKKITAPSPSRKSGSRKLDLAWAVVAVVDNRGSRDSIIRISKTKKHIIKEERTETIALVSWTAFMSVTVSV